MNEPALIVTCTCGWTVEGTEDIIITATRQHGRDLHNMEATDEQILAMAEPARR
jgi:hypothetical protein